MGYTKSNLALDRSHLLRFIRLEFVHIQCLDSEDQPYAGRKYKLELPNGDVIEDVLDSEGWTRQDDILPGECVFTLLPPEIFIIKMRMQDENNEDMSGLPFELECGSETHSGVTDAEGRLEKEIEAGPETGSLTVWLDADKSGESYTWPITIADHTS